MHFYRRWKSYYPQIKRNKEVEFAESKENISVLMLSGGLRIKILIDDHFAFLF